MTTEQAADLLLLVQAQNDTLNIFLLSFIVLSGVAIGVFCWMLCIIGLRGHV